MYVSWLLRTPSITEQHVVLWSHRYCDVRCELIKYDSEMNEVHFEFELKAMPGIWMFDAQLSKTNVINVRVITYKLEYSHDPTRLLEHT